ncbi:glycosyltransferase [Arthrobacter sp. SA17]
MDTYRVDGEWPIGSEEDRRRFGSLLSELAVEDPTAVTVVDGLVASGAPEEMERAAAEGRPVWVLLHMPLETPEVEGHALERRALAAAAGVMTTSSSVAALVKERHGIDGVTAALPGTEPAPLAGGSNPPHLIAVAALLPNKDQLILLGALAQLLDLQWTASLIGSDTADEGYAREVRAAVERLGLGSYVRLAGELGGEEFDAEWKAADLSLLVSRAEAYGLVVPESLAHGLPVIVRAGTGAVEALHAGSIQGNDAEAGSEGERGPSRHRRRARHRSHATGGGPPELVDGSRPPHKMADGGAGRQGRASPLGGYRPDGAGRLGPKHRKAGRERQTMKAAP